MKNFIVAIPGGFVQVGDYHTPTFFSVKTAQEATKLSESVARTVASTLHKGLAIQIDNNGE